MLEDLVKKIKIAGAKHVFIQLPEGLITKSKELEDLLSKEGIETFVSLEPCYGACDLRDCEAERLDCDLLVHVGHTDFGVESKIPVLYYEWRIDFDPVPILEKNLSKLPESIGLVSTVNFLDSLKKARKYLESLGKKCYVNSGFRTKYPGQILGCDVSAALKIEEKVDCFLFIGSGEFHALGLAIKTSKPVFSLKQENRDLKQVEKDKFVRQMHFAVALAKDCSNFGLLVSTKAGQVQIEKALEIKKKLEEKGKKAWIFTMDRITPEKLLGLNLDCLINCACPRVAVENRTSFGKPIINPEEL